MLAGTDHSSLLKPLKHQRCISASQLTFVLFPEHQFNVQVYANSDKVGQQGVILFASQDGKKLVVCCNDQQEVHPVEMVG